MLHEILRRGKALEEWIWAELEASVRFANASGALVGTRKGGIPAMPSLAEVQIFLARYGAVEHRKKAFVSGCCPRLSLCLLTLPA